MLATLDGEAAEGTGPQGVGVLISLLVLSF